MNLQNFWKKQRNRNEVRRWKKAPFKRANKKTWTDSCYRHQISFFVDGFRNLHPDYIFSVFINITYSFSDGHKVLSIAITERIRDIVEIM